MKDMYADPDHWATAYLWNHSEPFREIGIDRPFSLLTGIEVNKAFRHSGYASQLLRKVIEDADEERIVLVLAIDPDGSPDSLSYKELFEWYSRYNFIATPIPGVLKRIPQD